MLNAKAEASRLKEVEQEIVKLLVNEIYTDKNAKNLEGHTALEIAAKLPDGPAKTDIEKTLRRAGALKKSSAVSDLGEFLTSPRQWFQALIGRIIHEQREMSMEMRNTILVVAVLIATSTFQAVLQPPGGVMRGNYIPSASNTTGNINGTITTTNFISTNITHFNATIFDDNSNTDSDNPDYPAEIKLTKSMTFGSFFIDFFTLNTVCFLASITAMIFVLPLRLSSFMLHISMLFLIVSYGIAFYGISPTYTYANSFFRASYIAFPCAYSVWITISIISLFPKIRQYRFVPHKLWKRVQMLRDLYKESVDMSPKIPIQQSQI
ncbi:hypothetical protein LOK49_Contig32G00037 [Camellia lanceoleosa]|nr:hypothetical protein LOK49_Contig32G00037 [Camellia lanceoleosa]